MLKLFLNVEAKLPVNRHRKYEFVTKKNNSIIQKSMKKCNLFSPKENIEEVDLEENIAEIEKFTKSKL